MQFACSTGYVLDPTIGASYVCNNGQWSTKPRCLSKCYKYDECIDIEVYIIVTGRCPFVELQNFTTTTTGIQTTGQSSLMQLPTNTSYVLNGSYIVFSCISGYVNTGGSLNVTCSQDGSWSTFPRCVSSAQSTTTTTTTTAKNQGGVTTVAYSATCSTVPTVANAYISSATSIQYSNNVYVRKVVYTCNPGYTRVSTSGQPSVSCTNGVWETLPVCTGMLVVSKTIANEHFLFIFFSESNVFKG